MSAEIEIHTEIGSIAPEWDELAGEADLPPFLRPGWLSAWWSAFGGGRLLILAVRHAGLRQHMVDERLRCRQHTRQYGEDAPDVADWVWPG